MGYAHSSEFQELYVPVNRLYTRLVQKLEIDHDIAYVDDTSGFPDKGWFSVDREVVFYDSKNDGLNTFNDITRGVNETDPAVHELTAKVSQRINAEVFHELMKSVKKRLEFTLEIPEVAVDTTSEVNVSGFASRAQVHELRITASGGSSQFVLEFYRRNTFLGIDKIYETIELSSVESGIESESAEGQTIVDTVDTGGFLVDELIRLENADQSVTEFALVTDIVEAHLEVSDNLNNTFDTNSKAVLVHRDTQSFYYENLDWDASLHVRVINLDTVNPVTISLNIIAEVSDES